MEWYFGSFRRYREFVRGRARRTEFWTYTLCNTFVLLGLVGAQFLLMLDLAKTGALTAGTLSGVPTDSSSLWSLAAFMIIALVSAMYGAASLMPTIGVTIRRLHDIGRSGWWMLLGAVPILGLGLVIMLCLDSDPAENEFGLNPKAHPMTAERMHVVAMG